jgi:hypothetical protein
MSTRARAQLWKLQEAVRAASRERDRLMRQLESGRSALAMGARRELWMEFSLAEQEYRVAIAQLLEFCNRHSLVATSDSSASRPTQQ